MCLGQLIGVGFGKAKASYKKVAWGLRYGVCVAHRQCGVQLSVLFARVLMILTARRATG